MDKLFLIDGHALVFKMYYAFLRRPMINSKGADMSILYGFTKYLLELLEKELIHSQLEMPEWPLPLPPQPQLQIMD